MVIVLHYAQMACGILQSSNLYPMLFSIDSITLLEGMDRTFGVRKVHWLYPVLSFLFSRFQELIEFLPCCSRWPGKARKGKKCFCLKADLGLGKMSVLCFLWKPGFLTLQQMYFILNILFVWSHLRDHQGRNFLKNYTTTNAYEKK